LKVSQQKLKNALYKLHCRSSTLEYGKIICAASKHAEEVQAAQPSIQA